MNFSEGRQGGCGRTLLNPPLIGGNFEISHSLFAIFVKLSSSYIGCNNVNVALPSFASSALAVQQSINISFLPGPQLQTRRTLLQWVNRADKCMLPRLSYGITERAPS